MERISLPARFSDIAGQRFSRLVALWPVAIRANKHVLYECLCDCGATSFVTNSNLRSRHTQSCGCLMPERASDANGTHYLSRSKIYRRWTQMVQRCHLRSAPNYYAYGARGIKVCKRWRHGDGERSGFECFYADMGDPPPGLWIERIDNERGYKPQNCRWASPKEQAQNTRQNVRITWRGQTKILADWERSIGCKKDYIGNRLRHGWSVERALSSASKGVFL